MPNPREIELKLELTTADAGRLAQSLLPQLGQVQPAERLVSTYYDTPEHDLHKHGLSLRVRAMGHRRVQTIKARNSASAGLFDRSEWETDLTTPEPDLTAAAKTPLDDVLSKKRKQLAPVFTTAINRKTWLVTQGNATIEVALDVGEVQSDTASKPVAELELELKHGRPADLFTLVRRLEGASQLRLSVLAKSDRGYALIASKTPRAFKAEPVELERGLATADAFRLIVYGCLRHFRLNEPMVVERRAEPLHQARVGMRRLRSALSIFKPLVADETYEALTSRLRSVSRLLGEARNIDVYLERAAKPEAETEPNEPGITSFLATIEGRRDAAYDAVLRALESTDFQTLVLDLVEWLEVGPWTTDPERVDSRDAPIEDFAHEVLEDGRSAIKKKGRKLKALDPHARHKVRIRAKKLRYAAEFFSGCVEGHKSRARHAAFLESLSALQEHLGDLNDIQTAHELALDLAQGAPGSTAADGGGAFPAAHVSGEQDARIGDLLEKAQAAHHAFAATKRFWKDWASD